MVHDTYFYVRVKSSKSAHGLWKTTTLYLSNQFFVTAEDSGWAAFFFFFPGQKQAEK